MESPFIKNLTYVFVVFVFLSGLYFYIRYGSNIKNIETLENMKQNPRCPNILIQKDSKYYLYNSNLAKVPGVNPIEFANLEDYVEFLDWQRSSGIRCPVLYLQHTYDAQGNPVYKARPSVTDLQGGLPPTMPVNLPLKFTQLVDAGRDDSPYNQSHYPSFDQSSYYVGAITPLDMIDYSKEHMLYSDNPMDPNWGGQEYTQALVDAGYYQTNEVPIKIA
jgi:hypothetical protein